MSGAPDTPPPGPLRTGEAYRVRRPLPDSRGGEDLSAGTRLRLVRSVLTPRDLDRMLTFENSAGGRVVELIEADPRTADFFRDPESFLEPCGCAHTRADLADGAPLASLVFEVMGEEYTLRWRVCGCGALVEEFGRESWTAEHQRVSEPPMEEVLSAIARARACPDPFNKRCTCPAHEEARGGWA